MIDAKELKVVGLRFARALQIAVRTTGMLSVEHTVAAVPIQESFNLLNSVLKQQRSFTFGFNEGRILLENVLTTARGLNQLEDDFLKRGVSAVKFEAGLTLARYKAVLVLLATPIKKIEEMGGVDEFLGRQQIAGVRIFPASMKHRRTAGGDTVLDMDAEAFLRAQHAEEAPSAVALASMMDAAGFAPSATSTGPDAILARITPMVDAGLTPEGDPHQVYVSVAQMLQGVRPDALLSLFPAARQEEVKSLPPGTVAAEIIQSRAMTWASEQLASVPGRGEDAFVVEDRVVHALARSLHATQMANRLAGRLAKLFQEYSFPTHLVERVQDELKWIALPPEEKQKRLLATDKFTRGDFTRLLEHIRDLIKRARGADATEVAMSCLKLLDRLPDQIDVEELSRVPELIGAMAGVHTGFVQMATDKLLELLQRDNFDSFRHMQLLNALVALCKSAATYEDFEIVQNVGSTMDQLLAHDRERHAVCCGKMLTHLLPPAAFDRVLEVYLEKRTDAAFARKTAAMIHRAGVPAVEFLFQKLENETTGQNRMAMIRLISRMGPVGTEVVRQRLADARWFVVRNACLLLGELADPDMALYLAPVLQHADVRVQRAAAAALIKTRARGRAQLFAAALPFLLGDVLEQALDELMFLKEPETVADIERFVFSDSPGRSANLTRAVQALAGITSDAAVAALARVVITDAFAPAARKIALDALLRNSTPEARATLVTFSVSHPSDAFAAEIRRGMGASTAGAH